MGLGATVDLIGTALRYTDRMSGSPHEPSFESTPGSIQPPTASAPAPEPAPQPVQDRHGANDDDSVDTSTAPSLIRRHPPLRLPRGLIFLASLWLIASWLLVLGVRAPVQPSSASFTPAVELMLFVVTLGLMIGWPLLRLSMPATAWPIAQTVLDLIVLLALVQVVLWPLRLVTPWATTRTAALAATLAGWTCLVGAVVAAAIGTRHPGPRLLAMTACVAMCVLGPALAWLGVIAGVDAMQLVELSPLMAVRTLTSGGGAPTTDDQWLWIRLLAVAAALAWAALLMYRLCSKNRLVGSGHAPPKPVS